MKGYITSESTFNLNTSTFTVTDTTSNSTMSVSLIHTTDYVFLFYVHEDITNKLRGNPASKI